MKEYEKLSFEELRLEDLAFDRVKCPSCKQLFRNERFGTPNSFTDTTSMKTPFHNTPVFTFNITSSPENSSRKPLFSVPAESMSWSILENTSEDMSALSTEKMKTCLIDFVDKYHLAIQDDIKKIVRSEVKFEIEKLKFELTSTIESKIHKLKEEMSALKVLNREFSRSEENSDLRKNINLFPGLLTKYDMRFLSNLKTLNTENLSSTSDIEMLKENISSDKSLQFENPTNKLNSDAEKIERYIPVTSCSTFFEKEEFKKEVSTTNSSYKEDSVPKTETTTEHLDDKKLLTISKSLSEVNSGTEMTESKPRSMPSKKNEEVIQYDSFAADSTSEKNSLSNVEHNTEKREDHNFAVALLNEEHSLSEVNSNIKKLENEVKEQLLSETNPNEDKIDHTASTVKSFNTENISPKVKHNTVNFEVEADTAEMLNSDSSSYEIVSDTERIEEGTSSLKSVNSKNSSYEILSNTENLGDDTCILNTSNWEKSSCEMESMTEKPDKSTDLLPDTVTDQLSEISSSTESVKSIKTSEDITTPIQSKCFASGIIEETEAVILGPPCTTNAGLLTQIKTANATPASNTFGFTNSFTEKTPTVFGPPTCTTNTGILSLTRTTKAEPASHTFGFATGLSKKAPTVFGPPPRTTNTGFLTLTQTTKPEPASNISGFATGFSESSPTVFAPSSCTTNTGLLTQTQTTKAEAGSNTFGFATGFSEKTCATVFGPPSSDTNTRPTLTLTTKAEPASNTFGFTTGFSEKTRSSVFEPPFTSNTGLLTLTQTTKAEPALSPFLIATSSSERAPTTFGPTPCVNNTGLSTLTRTTKAEPTSNTFEFDTAKKYKLGSAKSVKVDIFGATGTVRESSLGNDFLVEKIEILLDKKLKSLYEKIHTDLDEVKQSVVPEKTTKRPGPKIIHR